MTELMKERKKQMYPAAKFYGGKNTRSLTSQGFELKLEEGQKTGIL